MTKEKVNWVAKWAVIVAICTGVAVLLSDANPLQRFMPRSHCMFGNQKLITLHLISDAGIFIAYTAIPIMLLRMWRRFKVKKIPFADFTWKFAGFIFFCGITHLVGVLNLWITFYWLDGIVKLATLIFSGLVCFSMFKNIKRIMSLRTSAELKELRHAVEKAVNDIKSLVATKNNTNA